MKYEILRDEIQTCIYKIIKNNFAEHLNGSRVLIAVRVSEEIETSVMKIIFENMDVLCEDEEIRPWVEVKKEK